MKVSLKIAIVILVIAAVGFGLLFHFQGYKPPKPVASSLSLTVNPPTIGEGKEAVLTGVLEEKEAAWRRISGREISFSYRSETEEGWRPIGKTYTDEKGYYSYLWSEASTLPPGSYLVKASWKGDAKYLSSFATARLRVIPVTKLSLEVDPSSHCFFTDVEGEKISPEFVVGTSTPWRAGKTLKDWYSPFFRELGDTYSFEPICCCPPPVGPNYGCCCHEVYWLVESTVPGSLKEKPPGVYSKVKWLHNVLDLPPKQPDYVPGLGPPDYTGPPPPARILEREKLHAQTVHAHSGDSRNADPDYSLRIYLEYGPGNDVEKWWYYGAEYPMWWKRLGMYGETTQVKEVEYIAELGRGAIIFEWYAYREAESEKLLDETHVGAYLMEVVVDITDSETSKTYKLHYVQDIFNPAKLLPENTSTDVYIREEGVMPKNAWQHYSHNLTKDFVDNFKLQPTSQHKITGIHLRTLWYKVSEGVAAALNFDDLKFTRLGISEIPISLKYNLTGCGKAESISATYTAILKVDGKTINSQSEEKKYGAPNSDLWSEKWEISVQIPPDADLEYGKTYSSAKLEVRINLEVLEEGRTIPLSCLMNITMTNVEWYGCLVPSEETVVNVK